MNCAEESRDHEGKEGVANDAHSLKECTDHLVSNQKKLSKIAQLAHIFPPRSLICHVTTTEPIQTSANTPVKTASFWLEVIDNKKLKSKEKTNGPLK
jgi:hypothetical protein